MAGRKRRICNRPLVGRLGEHKVRLFSGESIDITTAGKTINELMREVSKLFPWETIRIITAGGGNLLETEVSAVEGDLTIVKMPRGIKYMLGRMADLPGSRGLVDLHSVPDDPEEFRLMSSHDVYASLHMPRSGYFTAVRLMGLHKRLALYGGAACDYQSCFEAAQRITNPDIAIAMIIELHNDGDINVDRERFGPLARDLGLECR